MFHVGHVTDLLLEDELIEIENYIWFKQMQVYLGDAQDGASVICSNIVNIPVILSLWFTFRSKL